MTNRRLPARIHILLAREGPLGVVIRRGPSKHVCTLLWDRSDDSFRIGQWLKGRIYERRSDLSPNGEYMIYFAMNGKWESEARGSWTAISRAPYLKALALFPKGDCWNGGGLFTGADTYWLNGDEDPLTDTTLIRRDQYFSLPREQQFGGECTGVYYPRLLRDGWKLGRRAAGPSGALDVFSKPLPYGWALRKLAQSSIEAPAGKGCYYDEHELYHEERGLLVRHADWEWAEWDRSRLVWASEGRLYAGELGPDGLSEIRELFDFNPLEFEGIVAPY